jgi:predicted RNA-binding Zn-ribbon protein involved in translation (DUF1610 family)
LYSEKQKIDFIQRTFGQASIISSTDITVPCPKCDENKKKKLSISLQSDMFQCWVCGFKGKNLLVILKRYYPAKVNEYSANILGKKVTHEEVVEEQKLELPIGFSFLGRKRRLEDPDIKAARFYLKGRNISTSDIWYYKLGTYTSGRFRRRIFMPSFDDKGELNFYAARALDDDSFIKYLNAKIPKKTIIFNHINIDWSKELTLVEGPFDLMRCNENATAILGSALPEDGLLFQEIIKHKTPILLALDSDMPHKTHKIAKLLSEYNINARVINLSTFDDVGDMTKQQFEIARVNAKPWARNDRMSFMINNIKSGSIF